MHFRAQRHATKWAAKQINISPPLCTFSQRSGSIESKDEGTSPMEKSNINTLLIKPPSNIAYHDGSDTDGDSSIRKWQRDRASFREAK